MTTNNDNMLIVPQLMGTKGISASALVARETKSQIPQQSQVPADQLKALTDQVMENLKAQGVEGVSAEVVKSMAEQALRSQLVEKATDPVILPQPFVAPTDFAAQYPLH